ncbi:MAG TPA: two-component regulator propeller domain-containing protein [Acidobacteriota bacterium]|nr:two-component regulator propeller domain-containing protein [Acidobacteriota bacterium]HQM64147.1 two-component regulator propeller domain-containing protein [Acidobacteriota bacterium]
MVKTIPKLCVLLALLAGAAAAGKPIPDCRFDHLGVAEGLSESAVTAIIQDSRGFIWIGTHDGLNKYDGYTFTVYRSQPGNPDSLSDNAVSTLCEDRDGMLWVGTIGGGLTRFDPNRETFSRPRLAGRNPVETSRDVIGAIIQDRRGRIWIGHGGGIDRGAHHQTPSQSRFLRISTLTGRLLEDPAGSVWLIVGSNQLYRFDEDSGRFDPFPLRLPATTSGAPIRELVYLEGTGTLLVSAADRLYTFSLVQRRLLDEREPLVIPATIRLRGLSGGVEDESGRILLGTFGNGIVEIERRDRTVRQRIHDPNDPWSLSNNDVVRLMADRSGIIWIGTEGGGVNLIKQAKYKFTHHRHRQGVPNSLSGNYVTAIRKDASGDLWVGTGGMGLNRINEAEGTCSVYRHDPQRPETSLSHDYITSISEAAESGQLWIGTRDGLNRLDIRTGACRQYKHDPDRPGSLRRNDIHNTFLDRHGDLWVIAYLYLERLPRGRSEFVHYRHDPTQATTISDGPGYPIFEDGAGTIWIGSWCGGLNRYDRPTDTFAHYTHQPDDSASLSHDRVWAIHEDKRGRMWIGTYGGGLNRFDRNSGIFKRYLDTDGLASNVVYGILEDETGCLWLSSNNGLTRFNPETGVFRIYDVHDGLQGKEFNTRAFYRDREGNMYFGGTNGYNAFHPGSLPVNCHPPPVVITSITVGGRRVVPAAATISLGYDQNSVAFEFAALDYNCPAKNRYVFKLENLDADWNQVGADRRFADYRNIPPGEYTFRVRGSNHDGVWNETESDVTLRVSPPFWETWWFRAVALVAFGFCFYALVAFLKRHFDLIRFWKTRNVIGDYIVTHKIGSGGMGVVYKGVSRKNRSRVVALKVLNEEHALAENQRRRFLNEGAIIDSLDHPHIVKVYQRASQGNNLYIAMEYLDGLTLQDKLARDGKLILAEAVDIMCQLADVVAAVHQKGVIHRDLKPENIMLVQQEDRANYVKILDFGLAIMKNATRLTRSGMFMGTVGYTPPEQVSGYGYNFSGDIYSLGVIFYEMVTGEQPFFGETSLEIIKQILNEEPVEPVAFNPEIPAALNALILRLLSKDPGRRPTAADLRTTMPRMMADLQSV